MDEEEEEAEDDLKEEGEAEDDLKEEAVAEDDSMRGIVTSIIEAMARVEEGDKT